MSDEGKRVAPIWLSSVDMVGAEKLHENEWNLLFHQFSPGSFCSCDVYRHELGRCRSLPFFINFLSYYLSMFSFYINKSSARNIYISFIFTSVHIQGHENLSMVNWLNVDLFYPQVLLKKYSASYETKDRLINITCLLEKWMKLMQSYTWWFH